MNGFRNRRRAAAVLATAAALALGGAGSASAATANPLSGLFGSPPTTGQTGAPTGGLPGMGLFKAVFAVFGAVRTAVPTIAAPIIAQGVTDQTITPAEATQLTTLLAGQHMAPMMGAGAARPKPSAGEITILHKVFAAVLGQLATIAAPVLANEVTAGDLTQAESDLITKIITRLSGALSSATPTTATTPAALTGSAMSGNLLSTLASTVTTQAHKSTKHHAKHKKAKKAKAAKH